jgi:hypothetical protein
LRTTRTGLDLQVLKLLVLLRRKNTLKLLVDSQTTLQVLADGVADSTLFGILEVHAIEGVALNGIGKMKTPDKHLGLLASRLLGSALRGITNRLLSHGAQRKNK